MRPGLVVGLPLLLAADLVLAQTSEEEIERREAEIFGAPAPEGATPEADEADGDEQAPDDEQAPSEIETGPGGEPAPAGEPRPPDEQLTEEEEEVRRREAEIFGGAPPVEGPEVAPGEPASPTQELARPPTGLDVIEALEGALDIGGLAFLTLQYTFFRSGHPLDAPLLSPSFFDVYLDVRPSDRVRGYLEARLDFDFTAPPEGVLTTGFPRERQRLALDQLWLKLDVGRVAFLTLGKQRVRWGTGRFWNPTDFLNRRPRDPLDVFDRRLGVSFAEVRFPLEDRASSVTLISYFEDVGDLGNVGLAGRIEAVFFSSEITTTAVVQRGEPLRFGVDVSTGLWLLDLRAELAASFGSDQPFFQGEGDLGEGVLPEALVRSDEWILQLVLGGELPVLFSETDYFTLGLEYFYNDAGYAEPGLYPLLFQLGAFQPLYVGRHYLAGYVVLPSPGDFDDVTLLVSTIANLSDFSALTRFDASTLVLTFLRLNAWAALSYGAEGELNLPINIPPQPGVPGLEQGITRPAPLLQLGAALTLDF